MQAGKWDERYPPSWQLANSVVHQGTRSEAAVHTVPFLVRMALDARIGRRDRIVELLSFIAIGLDGEHLPDGYDPSEDRALLVELQSEAEAWTASWNAEHPDAAPIKPHEGVYAHGLLEAEAVVVCYEADSDGYVRAHFDGLSGAHLRDGFTGAHRVQRSSTV
jgi:hypothetical protein